MPSLPEDMEPRSSLDEFVSNLDSKFQASKDIVEVDIARRNLPAGQIVGILLPEPTSPAQYVCALGPCRHYVTQVAALPSVNEDKSGDGVVHTVRSHHCTLFRTELSGDNVYTCSSWSPALIDRALMILRGKTLAAHLRNIVVEPDSLVGYSCCRYCGKLRERSGVIDRAKRASSEKSKSEWTPQAFCWCGEKPESIPTAW